MRENRRTETFNRVTAQEDRHVNFLAGKIWFNPREIRAPSVMEK